MSLTGRTLTNNARPSVPGSVRSGIRWISYLRVAIVFILAGMLVTGCSMPQFGQAESASEPFQPTPYVAGEDVAGEDLAGAANEETTADEETAGSREASSAGDPADTAAATGSTGNAAADAPVAAAATARTTAPAGQSSRQRYNGEVEARDQVNIVAEVAGMILELNGQVGDRIMAGDLIARIDTATLEAQRAQALAGLEAAQAQLDLLLEDPKEEDLEAARAAVSAANASYRRALDGPTEEDKRLALAQLRQAEAAVTVAQAAYNRVKGNPLIGALPESLQLQQATLQLEAAQAQYDKVLKGSTDDVIAGAYAQLAQARAQLQRLEDGVQDAQIDAARAQVKQAETSLYLAQLQLDKARVLAPVDGVITQRLAAVGGMAAPGSPLLQLISSAVEINIAVEEFRLAELQVGQPVRITVNAYPDRIFQGEIARIAPQLEPATRTVQVTIYPVDDEGLLRPGMFANVELLGEQ